VGPGARQSRAPKPLSWSQVQGKPTIGGASIRTPTYTPKGAGTGANAPIQKAAPPNFQGPLERGAGMADESVLDKQVGPTASDYRGPVQGGGGGNLQQRLAMPDRRPQPRRTMTNEQVQNNLDYRAGRPSMSGGKKIPAELQMAQKQWTKFESGERPNPQIGGPTFTPEQQQARMAAGLPSGRKGGVFYQPADLYSQAPKPEKASVQQPVGNGQPSQHITGSQKAPRVPQPQRPSVGRIGGRVFRSRTLRGIIQKVRSGSDRGTFRGQVSPDDKGHSSR
jgi:hypothetical protein